MRLAFAIIGAQKAGTTALHRYLESQPDIFLPAEKELGFFAFEEVYRRDDFFARHFAGTTSKPFVGVSHAGTMIHPGAADRAYAHNPQLKLVAILRDPVARAYSAYWYHRRIGWDRAPTFEDAIERELAGELPDDRDGRVLSYVRNGMYIERLRPFLDRFEKDRIKLLLTEDLTADTAGVVASLVQWIGAEYVAAATDTTVRHNEAAMPRFAAVSRVALARDSRAKRLYRLAVPDRFRGALRQRIVRPAVRMNERPLKYGQMAAKTHRELAARFRDANLELAALLGRDLSHWGQE